MIDITAIFQMDNFKVLVVMTCLEHLNGPSEVDYSTIQ